MDITTDEGTRFLVQEQEGRLREYDGPLNVVIDVGAHVGTFTCEVAAKGAELIIAIEPDRKNFRDLVDNVYKNGFEDRVVCLPLAATASGNWESLMLRSGGTNSGQRSLEYHTTFPGQRVFTVDLLDMISILRNVDYLKVDIEGGEWNILNSPDAKSILQRVGYINIEGHPLGNLSYFKGDPGGARKKAGEKLLREVFDLTDYGPPQAPVWRGYRR